MTSLIKLRIRVSKLRDTVFSSLILCAYCGNIHCSIIMAVVLTNKNAKKSAHNMCQALSLDFVLLSARTFGRWGPGLTKLGTTGDLSFCL